MGKHEVARRAVFLDSDGVLNRAFVRNGHPYPPSSVEDFELHDEVAPGFARLKAANFLLVVITNQPGVGRGKQSRETGRSDAFENAVGAAVPLARRSIVRARRVVERSSFSAATKRVCARWPDVTVPNFNDAVNALLRDACL
jgi:D-glycero-D-manno-heptose 1,7-bisphosphate phosphatase